MTNVSYVLESWWSEQQKSAFFSDIGLNTQTEGVGKLVVGQIVKVKLPKRNGEIEIQRVRVLVVTESHVSILVGRIHPSRLIYKKVDGVEIKGPEFGWVCLE